MSPVQWLMLATLSLLWGSAFLFVELALEGASMFWIVWGRVAVAAVVLGSLAPLYVRGFSLKGASLPDLIVMALLNNAIPYTLLVYGQTSLTAGATAILISTTPFMGVIAAHWFTRDEPLSVNKVAGVLTGLAGVAVIVGPTAAKGIGSDVLAQLAVLGAGLSYASAAIWGRRFRRLHPEVPATGQLMVSSFLLLPVLLLVEQPWRGPMPSLGALGAIAALGLICTAAAYLLYFRLLARAGATNVLLVTFLIPVAGVVLGVLFLNEVVEARQIAGMALIGGGLAAVDGRPVGWLLGRGARGRRVAPVGLRD